jgi:hypothetical protein
MNISSWVEFSVEVAGMPQPVSVRIAERDARAMASVACGRFSSSGLGATAREALVAALAPLGRKLAATVMAAPDMFGASVRVLAAHDAG